MICPHETCTCEVESGHCSDACAEVTHRPDADGCPCDHDACDG